MTHAPITRRQRGARRALMLLGCCLSAAACTDSVVTPTSGTSVPALRSSEMGPADAGANEALAWDRTALEAVTNGTLGPPMVARALAVVHTAMFDAWAAYDDVAVGTRLGASLRRPAAERTYANKRVAVSYAAYRTLKDLFPAQSSRFDARMAALGLDPMNGSQDVTTAVGVGNVAAAAVLAFRHADGSNQDGTMSPSGRPYADYTGYVAANSPDVISDPNRWQPLRVTGRDGITSVQTFVGAQWPGVVPFALTSSAQFRPPPPIRFPDGRYRKQAEDLIRMSAALGDREKCIAEYWADGPNTVLPPGHWALFAQYVSLRDRNTLDQDVQLFFLVSNAVFDAGIAAWDAKLHYDYVRPVTAIHFLKHGEMLRAWAGPGLGARVMDGDAWRPYQPAWSPTPPFPEYVSGHSTFSAAGAEILKRFTGSDSFGASVVIDHGALNVEPGMPAKPVTLSWATFSAAADEAGISRRYGGIHFEDADLAGRRLGRLVGTAVWGRGREYIEGRR